MTSRTHDLGAFTAANIAFIYLPMPPVTVATLLVAFFANMMGGLFPDLDESTAAFWEKIRGGTILARLISPLLGGHRLISHSIIGLVATGFLLDQVLKLISPYLIINLSVTWFSFMAGMLSHLVLDSLTKEGVPWLFPLPFKFGFPPLKMLRIKTGGLIEKSLIFPGLLVLNAYLIYTHYGQITAYLSSL